MTHIRVEPLGVSHPPSDPEALVQYVFLCSTHGRFKPNKDCQCCLAARELRKQHMTAIKENTKYLVVKRMLNEINQIMGRNV
jgi:hypothetical protein